MPQRGDKQQEHESSKRPRTKGAARSGQTAEEDPRAGHRCLLVGEGLPLVAGPSGDPGQPDTQEPNVLRAFDAGADDFIARPVPCLELRARLRALLRRTESPRPVESLQIGPLEIDTGAYAASLHGDRLQLRHLEYELLLHLADDTSSCSSAQRVDTAKSTKSSCQREQMSPVPPTRARPSRMRMRTSTRRSC
jgi:hypothetical protein